MKEITELVPKSPSLLPEQREQKYSLEEIAKASEISLNLISKPLRRALEILHKYTKTLEDEADVIELLNRFLAYLETKKPPVIFTEEKIHSMKMGTFLSDIGKVGSPNVEEPISELVAQMFGIDVYGKEYNPSETSVEEFLLKYLATENQTENQARDLHRRRLGLLGLIKIKPEMKMREFYDLHILWTWEWLETQAKEGNSIPNDTLVAAQAHHALEGLYPAEHEGRLKEEKEITALVRRLNIVQKFILLFDRYQARLRRGEVSHEEAIEWLRTDIHKRIPSYPENGGLYAIIKDMEAALGEKSVSGKEFPSAAD